MIQLLGGQTDVCCVVVLLFYLVFCFRFGLSWGEGGGEAFCEGWLEALVENTFVCVY